MSFSLDIIRAYDATGGSSADHSQAILDTFSAPSAHPLWLLYSSPHGLQLPLAPTGFWSDLPPHFAGPLLSCALIRTLGPCVWRGGVPDDLRGNIWAQWTKGSGQGCIVGLHGLEYSELLELFNESKGQQQQQLSDESLSLAQSSIETDVRRSLNFLRSHFLQFESSGSCSHLYYGGSICHSSLVRLLLLFSKVQRTVGYCQGMVMIAAVIAYVLPPQLSLQGLLHAIGCVLPLHYFSPSMSALQVDLVVLELLLQKHSSREHAHLQQLGLASSSYGTQMLLQGFVPFCSPALLLRLWDVLLFASVIADEADDVHCEGWGEKGKWMQPRDILLCACVCVVRRSGSAIVRAQDAEEALKALKGGLAKAAPESFMLWLHSMCTDCSADVAAFRRQQLSADAAAAAAAATANHAHSNQ